MATDMPIGTRIRRARERKRMRQADLAAALGVSRQTVDAWENDRAYPRSSIGALEEILGVTLNGGPGHDDSIARLAEDVTSSRDLTERQKRNRA
jgi:transcriptional regulator with XRE-family HTH domain